MNRVEAIQRIIDKKRARTYLEIGFGLGDCFFNIRAPRKIVVDPAFHIFKKRTRKYFFKNLSKNISNRYYKMKSDDFFARFAGMLSANPPDVVFIDGLHTFKQSLKDTENSLSFLDTGGVIILHDCNPGSAVVAHPAESAEQAVEMRLPGWTGTWSGDVWKTIAYLRSARNDLEVFVLDFDMGLGIIRRGKRQDPTGYAPDDIGKLSYKDLENDRKKILNLKSADYLDAFIGKL